MAQVGGSAIAKSDATHRKGKIADAYALECKSNAGELRPTGFRWLDAIATCSSAPAFPL
ncbi:hypothetical protein DSM3645_10197 [Blastopirellula marina DSM 3645]|uniref:Uncharacterized protein n=1 Tax=Blastopirellula marina DSM 3645 TaxID=314230 RepID=A3ZLY0_9BACT|nr:hypothetical protein DSM3645_10197 [Blastopirellula marina DSM 3645]